MGKHSLLERPRLIDVIPHTSEEYIDEHNGHDHHDDHDHDHAYDALVSPLAATVIVGGQATSALTQMAGMGYEVHDKGITDAIDTINPATSMDLIHNVGDVVGWAGHSALAAGKLLSRDPVSRRRLKLGTYITISSMGGLAAAEGARSLMAGSHDYAQNYLTGAGSVMSLGAAALTGTLTYLALKRKGYTSVRDVWKSGADKKMAIHAGTDLATATASFMSTLPNMHHSIGSIASIIGGVALASVFRWTRKNIEDEEHHCVVHGAHEHDEHHPATRLSVAELVPGYQQKSWRESMQYKGRHRREREPVLRRGVKIGKAMLGRFFGSKTTSLNVAT